MDIVSSIRANRLSSRLLLTYVTLMVLGLGALIAFAGQRLADENIQRAEHELELQAQIIANAMRDPIQRGGEQESSGGRSINNLVASYAQDTDARVTLLDPQFNVLQSSEASVPLRSEENYPELTAARAGGEHFDIRWDDESRAERLFVAAAASDDRQYVIGLIQLSVPMAPIYAKIQRTWLDLIMIGGAVLLVTVLASFVLARQIAVPVQHLTITSEEIAQGHLDERVAPSGPDEIRRLGLAFNSMAERVQEMLSRQREFVDNAAHELRSPLTGLRLRIEMLQSHGKDNADLTQRYLGQMEHEVGYLQRLVDHLLMLASVEEKRTPAPRVALDIAPLLYQVVDEVSVLAQQARVAVQSDVPAHLPCVQANPEQMSIVLRNLLDNAVKYTSAGGTITIGTQVEGNQLAIRIADTGSGIPTEALPHIFDRFYRVNAARSRSSALDPGGAGLGLALVQAIVQAHEGRIEVASQVGQGSTFTVYLPTKE